MKTLITAVEEWIDDRVWKASRVAEHEAQFDANELKLNALHEQVAELERRLQLYLDSPSPEAYAEEPMYEADQMLSELIIKSRAVDSRLDDLECSMEEKTDSHEVEDIIQNAVGDLDFPDSYAIEVMIADAVETKVMDAVMAEINATDFKITVRDKMKIKSSPDFLTVRRRNITYKINKHEIGDLLGQVYDDELKHMAFHVSEYKILKDNKIGEAE